MKLKNKVAIVTGSTRGIGKGIAIAFHQAGARVVVSGRDEKTGIELAETLNSRTVGDDSNSGKSAIFIKADVSDREDIVRLRDLTLAEFGRIDILVNNAGVNAPYPMEKLPLEAWNKVMQIDLNGVLFCSQIIGAEMIKCRRGAIINITSIAGLFAYPDGGAYGPAKAAVNMLTKQCAMEWAGYNIRVNAISPGLILTPLSENIYKDEEITRTREAIVPLGRIGKPEDIAPLAVFLASEDASYITGQDILVDGGLTGSVYQKIPGRANIKEPM